MTAPGSVAQMLAGLLEAGHLATFDDLPALVARHGATAGLVDVAAYVADIREDNLVRLDDAATRLPIDTSAAGWAFRNVDVVTSQSSLWVPMLDGTERIGVLGARAGDGDTVVALRALASLAALLVVSKRPHSDSYPAIVRSRPMSLPSEVIWPLMPPLTFATKDLVVAAVLEPTYEIGGDAVDYAVSPDLLHLSMFDAMGHDQSAGLTVAIATGACRNTRRRGATLPEIGEAIDDAIARQFDRKRFATGVLAHLRPSTGLLTWINRGHPPPLLIRQGRWLTTLRCPPAPPMGFALGIPATECRYQLEPGDRVLFHTDGITEARDHLGREFGLRRFTELVVRGAADGLPAPETLRRLMRAVLAHQNGRLQDDATALMLEWRGDQQRRLTIGSG
ncbi:PP2C family protein-serine/threonine phosphatase [Kutzneria sp. 744]|uniref:PP2C family protein-serine/threonine phosphatase n=1 Tax=Kutzneria sp. (strain 744) TaxID=345341 RepID=UPI0003EED71C|nr:PP2C family protein-serine/threonine phosphatase [Kutzneria sp. 744]EWM10716.1 stage II sporulation protein E (SpoIIE) [Kutzneria sp. 744]